MIFRVAGDGQYCLTHPESGIEFRADHLRRESRSGELTGELSVACGLTGARTTEDDILSTGSFNFSSVQARTTRANILRAKARTAKVPFDVLLEEFCQRIAYHERHGQPAVVLRDVPRRDTSHPAFFDVCGVASPTDQLEIKFGTGGTMKSYFDLFVASERAKQGERVLYCDWELDAETHRDRLERINGPDMPDTLLYARCDRPLVHEIDRLRRIRRAERITYVVLDSIGYGTAGDPAAADAAMDFCRAVRQFETGVSAVAHITKNGEQNDQMPYGSVFWHNSARMTWNFKVSATSDDGQTVALGAFNRKNNLGPKRSPVGINVTFDGDRVYFTRTDIATIDEFVDTLPLWQRIKTVVKAGPQTLATIASELNYDKVDSLDRIVRKHKQLFTKVTGPDGIHRIALVERRVS